jgi:DNA polymerase IV
MSAGSPPAELHVLHVDMDAFFAAVEALDDPSLAGKPLIVGGSGARGVVASCSYEARAFGVRSAMPSVQARRLCPAAIFVDGRHSRYQELSTQLHAFFADFTPVIEPIALDEAYLDVRGALRLFGSAVDIAWAIRRRVAEDLRLDCSVGVARSKLIAKLASRAAKPRAERTGTLPGPGVFLVAPEDEIPFLHPLPASAVPGVGPATLERLRRYGISTVGDLAVAGRGSLERLLGRSSGRQLHDLAWARDERPVVADRPLKSVGHEETFAHDDHDLASLQLRAVRMADSVGRRLRAAGVVGRTVTVKVRFGDFKTITRSRTVPAPISSGPVVARVANSLLGELEAEIGRGVRLLGVTVSSLAGHEESQPPGLPHEQLSFEQQLRVGVDETAEKRSLVDSAERELLDDAIDRVRQRFGSSAVGPASLVDRGRIDLKQEGEAHWGPSGRTS